MMVRWTVKICRSGLTELRVCEIDWHPNHEGIIRLIERLMGPNEETYWIECMPHQVGYRKKHYMCVFGDGRGRISTVGIPKIYLLSNFTGSA